MAIRALNEGQWFLEVSTCMATCAWNVGVLAQQGKLGLRMIKCEIRRKLLPTGRGMAVFAALLEFPVVRIHVASATSPKFHVFEARDAARSVRLMTLLAGDLEMHTS